MRRILLRILALAVLGFALWLGITGVRGLFRKPVTHEAVIVNRGKRAIVALDMRVGRRRLALGAVAGGDTARAEFRVARDAPIELRWTWEDAPGDEHLWRGGTIARGPLAHHMRISIHDDGGVLSRVVLSD